MAVRTYDPKSIIITIGAATLTGYADDSFVQIEEQGDGVAATVGANGEVARSLSPDRTCRITVTLQQTSPGNDILSALAESDRLTGNGLFPLAIADLRGSTVLEDSNSWVVKKANTTFGKTAGNREWTLQTSNDVDYTVGGSAI